MATETLDYGRDGRWSFRQLPWRRIILGALAAYVLLYGLMRAKGVITHSWGAVGSKVSGEAYAGHIWRCKSDAAGTVFAPLILLEQGVRDLRGR